MELARVALDNGNRQEAWDNIHGVCLNLLDNMESTESKIMYVSASLDLSQLGFVPGKSINVLTLFLTRARESADLIGDRRSRALINLHLGRLYYFSQRRNEAAEAFEKGSAEVKELGDDDIPLLSRHFLKRYAAKYHRTEFQLTDEDENRLKAYSWPGNVRELKNVLERASLLSGEGEIDLDLPSGMTVPQRNPFEDLPSMDEVQRRYIRYVLEHTKGKQSGREGATEILGMNRSTLYNKMKKLGIVSA
jgi:hypothetical protein